MALFLFICALAAIGVVITYRFIVSSNERELLLREKEEELEELRREFLIRYAYNRKDSKPVNEDELTSMILQDIMQTDADVVMGTVTYDSNGKPTIHKAQV